MRIVARVLTSMATLAFVAACSDNGGGTTGDALTVSEIGELTGQLVEPMFDLTFGANPAPPVMAAAAAGPIQSTVECPEGGSLGISGDLTETQGGGSVDLTETVNGCQVTVGTVTFTLNGDPNVTMSGSGNDISGSLTLGGGFTFTSNDGREGGCGIDVSASITGVTVSFDGNVCGVDVDQVTDDVIIN